MLQALFKLLQAAGLGFFSNEEDAFFELSVPVEFSFRSTLTTYHKAACPYAPPSCFTALQTLSSVFNVGRTFDGTK